MSLGHARCTGCKSLEEKILCQRIVPPKAAGNQRGERHEVTQKKQWKEKVNNNMGVFLNSKLFLAEN